MEAFLSALAMLFSPTGLFLMVAGGALALIMGMLPGLSSTEAMLIILPFTYAMSLADSMIILNAAYATAFIGGALTSILFGIPGSSMNVATIFDGYPMRRQGRTFQAIGAAGIASVIGNFVAVLLVIIIMPVMVPFSLLFGPPEWFAFITFGLVIMAMSGEASFRRTIISGMLGLIVGCIGLSTVTGAVRFTFGSTFLWGGVNIIPVFIGLYPLAEVIDMTLMSQAGAAEAQIQVGTVRECMRDIREGMLQAIRRVRVWTFSSFIGWFIGVVPGVGGTLANMMGYVLVKRTSRHPQTFGKGEIEGVIAAESANIASVAGAMVPCLALGIPGSLNTAILLGMMMIHGIQPGTNLFGNSQDIAWVILLTISLASVFAAVVVLLCGWKISRLLNKVDIKYIVPPIVFIGMIATILARNNVFDIVVALVFGLVGYGMKHFDFSRICFVIALMLGPILESSFFQSLNLSRGSFGIFFTRPVVLIIWVILIIMCALVVFSGRRAAQEEKNMLEQMAQEGGATHEKD